MIGSKWSVLESFISQYLQIILSQSAKCCIQYNYTKLLHFFCLSIRKEQKGVDKYNCRESSASTWCTPCVSVCVGEEFQDFYILFHSNNPVLSLFLHYRFQPHILYHRNLWSLNSEAVQHKPSQVQTVLLCPINMSWFLIVCISKL